MLRAEDNKFLTESGAGTAMASCCAGSGCRAAVRGIA